MRRIWRLLHYMRPYTVHVVVSVLLMAVVGALAAFRILLIKPIVDNVLNAGDSSDRVVLFMIPHTHYRVDLRGLLPHHFHNAWTVVAVALVGSAIIKSICDYTGHVAGEQGRLRDDYGPAQRPLRFDAAADRRHSFSGTARGC